LSKNEMTSARLMFGDSAHGADMRYASRVNVPDAFLWLEHKSQQFLFVSKLEFDRVSREVRHAEVRPLESYQGKRPNQKSAAYSITIVAQEFGLKSFLVPPHFPLGLATDLRKKGLRLVPVKGEYFPQRRCKTKAEVEFIRQAQAHGEAGLDRGLEVLRASRITAQGALLWRGTALTSERLRGEIDATIVQRGGLPEGTIVAGGDQACDPHERGHGPLRAHQAIILDIFPRDQRTGYFGDLTRTVVRGLPSEALRHLYATVQAGQRWVLSHMKVGADGRSLQQQLTERFREAGFPTEQRAGRWVGFFHGVGHSLGLEIHEPPRFSAGHFEAGTAMTVEPGLYYPGLGGVRIEDLVILQKKGVVNLTSALHLFEI
jgi:Xaa-Pro aminopeptidase